MPGVGVEPTRLSSVDFESTASANSATRAFKTGHARIGPGCVHAKFVPVPSVWGHFAGGPGTNPKDVEFIDAKLKELLAS